MPFQGKKWYEIWRSFEPAQPDFRHHVNEKLEYNKAACEIEILDEAGGRVDFLEMELADEEKNVDRHMQDADIDSWKLHEEDLKLRNSLTARHQELEDLQKERAELALQLDTLNKKTDEDKQLFEKQQNELILSLEEQLECLRGDTQGKISAEITQARTQLELNLTNAKSRLGDLHNLIQQEHGNFALAVRDVDRQKNELQALALSIRRESQAIEDRESELMTQRNEIQRLKDANIELRKLSEDLIEPGTLKGRIGGLKGTVESVNEIELLQRQGWEPWELDDWEHLTEKEKEERRLRHHARIARETPTEILILRRGQVPGFAIIGADLDNWIVRTEINVIACIGSFGPDGHEYLKNYVPNPPDGVTCQTCGCGARPHSHHECRICRSLDLQDATLFP